MSPGSQVYSHNLLPVSAVVSAIKEAKLHHCLELLKCINRNVVFARRGVITTHEGVDSANSVTVHDIVIQI